MPYGTQVGNWSERSYARCVAYPSSVAYPRCVAPFRAARPLERIYRSRQAGRRTDRPFQAGGGF